MAANVEEFEPTTEWALDQAFDTVLVFLPGFKKDQLTVQVTSNRKLRVMGERQNADKRSRFHKEVLIPTNLDTSKVGARFDNEILYVRFPKVIAPAEPQPKPATTTPEAPKPTSEPQSQREDQQQPKTDAIPKVEKPDKPKQGDITPKTSEDKKQRKEGSPPSKMSEVDKKPKAEKPDMEKAEDDARRAKKESTKVDAADFSLTGPSERKGAPVKKPRSSKGQEGEERTEDKRTGKGYHEDFLARIKQPKNLMNSIVAVLLVLILAVYLKYAFKSFIGRQ